MKLRDTFALAFRTVRGNKLRTGLTVAIIAFGIMALVGIRTAITAMEQKFVESFSAMGATGFTVRYREPRFRFGGGDELKKEKKGEKKEKKSNIGKPITKIQAELFKENFKFPAQISLNLFGAQDAVVSSGGKKSNPNTRVYGGDENYLDQNGFKVAYGRNLNQLDLSTGRNVCLIGADIVKKFFGDDLERAVDKTIKINNIPFRVVGTLNAKGSTLGMSLDNVVITSYNNVRRFFNSNPNASFSIQVKVPNIQLMDAATGEAISTFRPIRKLTTTEDDNFAIDKSDSFASMLLGLLSSLTISALVIGFITLLGAAIGLTNIMLVAVTERTKEIGLVKAIGGKAANVRWQFLFESTIISIFGAIIGIILGVLVGNLFSMYLNTGFVIPWGWTIAGIVICTLVGLVAGLYPARKASRLNPIEALRYE
ncbi:ABC transporter permease [Pseudoflavitalea sp. G-6-1-2]|uniref:ABC transporter permease n=1 Tax=Pseudoflavitalea sp. G-6-1-2 TaxID=2728841 RepID=UPI00146ADA90|nr:ABC transporter permease [Pseudoflavitalea sp. G-6-1-2]NML19278.1 ABC transporter permease [Pseudoflavitalea sp. G-6-1-2]